jgi:signal transduction histidine kinase
MTAEVLNRPEEGLAAAQSKAQTTPSRWDWRNWPVVVKLAAVLLVPTIIALVAGVMRIVDQASAAPGYARISRIVQVQQQLSDLIGALARERVMATAFVAQGRTENRQPLEGQFRVVDGDAQRLRQAVGQVSGLGFARPALATLGGLAPLRASVTTGFAPVEVVVTEYSDAINPLVELDAGLSRQLDDVAVTNDAAAVHALLAGREQISRQHAIVLAALYANRLTPSQIDDLRTAATRLAVAQDAVREALPPADRVNATRFGGEAELSRQRLLQLVLNRGIAGQPLNTSPDDWNQRNAVVEDSIATVEKDLRQRIDRTAQGLLQHVRTAAGLNAVILFFALAIGVLIGIVVTRALLRPLGVLKRTALEVADRRLPEAMSRLREGDAPDVTIDPVPVRTSEEIGQVARAFDEVHSQAVRLASEQAQLRANVNDIFVSLSRRTQGLVERQLKLIDRLESGEQDPQQLDNLFQLDHLATRMRRNSENLLVLAGAEATNRSGRPVRLVDVLRAAVSEVEQYQRLVLQQPPAILVLGRAANDLVHLLSELLDNATQFSPPDSQVMVSSEAATDGSVSIEVADRGVGMTDEELAQANERLANPQPVDASVSRRMGLFVVGRLASRHGIEVRLRRGEAGVGIWACVTLPPRLVRVASETPEKVQPQPAAEPATTTNGSGPAGAAPGGSAAGGPAAGGSTAGKQAPAGESMASPSGDAPGTGPASDPALGPGASEANRTGPKEPAPQGADRGAASAGPPPAPPAPPESPPVDLPPDGTGEADGTDLFRPARATPAGSGGSPRVTLQHSTPIFDDVASAWFKKHDAVPVRWNGAPAPPPAERQQTPAPERAHPGGDTPVLGKPAERPSPGSPPTTAASSGTGAPPLVRRQPGKTLAQSAAGEAGARLPGQPAPAPAAPAPAAPAPAAAQDWGGADEGWRAAQALAMPVSTEFTSVGLPKRQPRALLVPGAAGEAEQGSAPVRTAESVRGRLSSYQQGIREARQARRNLEQQAGTAPAEQEDNEGERK